MKLKLNTWQRISLFEVIGSVRGGGKIMYFAHLAIKVLRLSEKEKARVGYREIGDGVTWTDRLHTWEIEFKDPEVANFVKQHVKTHEGWPAVNAELVLDLLDQLDIEYMPKKEEDD